MGEDQVGGADGDGLQVGGDFIETGEGENIVEVIEDGVDAGELVEHADGDGRKIGRRYFQLKSASLAPCSA